MNEKTNTPVGQLESARGHIQAAMNDIARSLTLQLQGPGVYLSELRQFYRCLKAAGKSMRIASELSKACQAPETVAPPASLGAAGGAGIGSGENLAQTDGVFVGTAGRLVNLRHVRQAEFNPAAELSSSPGTKTTGPCVTLDFGNGGANFAGDAAKVIWDALAARSCHELPAVG